MRACPSCGVTEQRQMVNGRESVNLDPVTGWCVDCMIARSRSQVKVMPSQPVDFAKKAAHDED